MDIRLHLPFVGGAIPVTFPFGAHPTDERMRTLFQTRGVIGHHGVDFGLPMASLVLAVDDGTVAQTGERGEYGIAVTIDHAWGQSLYAHLLEAKVKVGQSVKSGELIGLSGKTGAASGPHLHLGIKPNNPDTSNSYLGFVDPMPFFFDNPLPTPQSSVKVSKSEDWAYLSQDRRAKQRKKS